MTEKMIKTAGVAKLLGVSTRTLSNWLKSKPDFPKPIETNPKGGASNYWLASDIEAYILKKKLDLNKATSHQAGTVDTPPTVVQEQVSQSPAIAAVVEPDHKTAEAVEMTKTDNCQQSAPPVKASQGSIRTTSGGRQFLVMPKKQRVRPPVETRRVPITDINRSYYSASAPAVQLPPVSQLNPAPIEQPVRVIEVVQQVVRPPPVFRFEGEPPLKNLSQSQAAQQLINPRPTFRFRDEPVSGSPSPSEVEQPVREKHEESHEQYEVPRTSLEEFHEATYQEAMSGELSDDAQRIETPDEFDELEESGHEYDQGLDEEPSDEDN